MDLIVATTNRGKIREIRTVLEGLGLRLRELSEWPEIEAPEETGETFEANALLKARHYRDRLETVAGRGGLVLADDSGLEIGAWGNWPGIHSARAFDGAPYAERNRLICQRLAGESNRTARFVCALALAGPRGRELMVRATAEGEIAREARGTDGFGYDPIFLLPELGRTFGELSHEEKWPLSHRGKALLMLREKLAGFLGGE